jgi:hypothetical protein
VLARPGLLLRIEGGALLAIAVFFYHSIGATWGMFALLFLWPDVSMLGYAAGSRLGAQLYNLCHWETLPFLLASASFSVHRWRTLAFALIWLAHIGADRLLGYGLKYPTFFKDTHLQRANAPAGI